MLTKEQQITYLKRAIDRRVLDYNESARSRVRSTSTSFDLDMDYEAIQRLRDQLAELEGQDDA